jgi:hypothetical protein
MIYNDDKEGIAKFTKDVLEPLVQQFGYGSCIYEEDAKNEFDEDSDYLFYPEGIVIRDLNGDVCRVIDVTGDSCSACAIDLFEMLLIKE